MILGAWAEQSAAPLVVIFDEVDIVNPIYRKLFPRLDLAWEEKIFQRREDFQKKEIRVRGM